MRTSLCFTQMSLWNQIQNSVIPKSFPFLLGHTKKSKFTSWTGREPVSCCSYQGDVSSVLSYIFNNQFKTRRLEASIRQGVEEEGLEAENTNGKSGMGCSDFE